MKSLSASQLFVNVTPACYKKNNHNFLTSQKNREAFAGKIRNCVLPLPGFPAERPLR
jgi:hypothetical protein